MAVSSKMSSKEDDLAAGVLTGQVPVPADDHSHVHRWVRMTENGKTIEWCYDCGKTL